MRDGIDRRAGSILRPVAPGRGECKEIVNCDSEPGNSSGSSKDLASLWRSLYGRQIARLVFLAVPSLAVTAQCSAPPLCRSDATPAAPRGTSVLSDHCRISRLTQSDQAIRGLSDSTMCLSPESDTTPSCPTNVAPAVAERECRVRAHHR
jgi:hypothetical protein